MKKILCLIPLLLNTVLLAQPPYSINDFSGGLNKKNNPLDLEFRKNQCEILENILTDEGGLKSRAGIYGLVSTANFPWDGKKIKALWEYKKENGERFLVAHVESRYYATVDVDSGTWTAIKTDVKWQQNETCATIHDDYLVLTNGINYVCYWDGSLSADSCTDLTFLPKFFYIESHNNKLFGARTYDHGNRIWYTYDNSDFTDPESWDLAENSKLIGQKDGQKITGLKSYGDLFVTKDKSIYGLFGETYTDWQRIKVDSYYGCTFNESIFIDKGRLKWISKKGIMSFGGGEFEKIDSMIEDETTISNTVKGDHYYLQQTTTDDFDDGTVNQVTYANNQLTLQDKTTTWSSFAAHMGTYTNISATSDGFIIPTATASWTTSSSTITATVASHRIVRLQRLDARDREEHSGRNPIKNTYIGENQVDELTGYIEEHYTEGMVSSFDEDIEYYHTPYDTVYNNITYFTNTDEEDVATLTQLDFYVNDDDSKEYNKVNRVIAGNWRSNGKYNQYTAVSYEFDFIFERQWITKFSFSGEAEYVDYLASDYVKTTAPGEIQVLVFVYARNLSAPTETDKWQLVGKKQWELFTSVAGGSPAFRRSFRNDFEIDITDSYTEELQMRIIFFPKGLNVDAFDETPVYFTGFARFKKLNDFLLYTDDNTNQFTQFESSGTFETNIYDFGQQVLFSTFTANFFDIATSSLTFDIKSSTDSSTWSAWFDVEDGQAAPCPDGRYVVVKASYNLTVTTGTVPPIIIYGFELSAINSTGTFESKNLNVNKLNLWKYFIADDADFGETITYGIKIATGTTALSEASYTTFSSGDLVTDNIASATSTAHTHAKIKVTLTSANGQKNPICKSLTLTYAPDQEKVVPAVLSIDDRGFIAMSTGTFTTYNNIVYVHDKKGNWTTFTGWYPNCFVKYGNSYYVASATSSNLFRIGAYITDNGIPIQARWVKTLDFDINDLDKKVVSVVVNGKQTTSGHMTFAYKIENNATEYSINKDVSGTGFFSHKMNIPRHSKVRHFEYTIKSTTTFEMSEVNSYIITENRLRR